MVSQYIVAVAGGAHGYLGAEHLADHPSAVTALQGALTVGSPLGPLLVLERVEVSLSIFMILFSMDHHEVRSHTAD